jgi:hypothetical protein
MADIFTVHLKRWRQTGIPLNISEAADLLKLLYTRRCRLCFTQSADLLYPRRWRPSLNQLIYCTQDGGFTSLNKLIYCTQDDGFTSLSQLIYCTQDGGFTSLNKLIYCTQDGGFTSLNKLIYCTQDGGFTSTQSADLLYTRWRLYFHSIS